MGGHVIILVQDDADFKCTEINFIQDSVVENVFDRCGMTLKNNKFIVLAVFGLHIQLINIVQYYYKKLYTAY